MRIIVSGGGTGGHIFPALEIIKEIKRQDETIDVILAGNIDSLEEKMAQAQHIPFFGLSTQKIVGQSLGKKILAVSALVKAITQCLWFLAKNRPKAVVGVGGYVSAPMVIASFLLGIKRYIAEQNVTPGLANRYLGRIATKVFISFKESKTYFKAHKTVLSGNPVRKEFFGLKRPDNHEGLKILITGGSLGARSLNTNIPQVLAQIHHECPKLSITHQTGQAMVDEVALYYQKAGINAAVTAFINDMPKAFSEHDLLISRAGATVIAEIMASGTPAILIPYPFALGHQKNNALALVNAKAGLMVLEGPEWGNHLALTIKNIYSDKNLLNQMASQAKSMGTPDAAFIMVRSILYDP
jgi:UDP-N-acetylglucosamine--N-acetylmuramyl-(pentapeptide) pyrophosphoryl-undecaprenol N-acetylglucosamine transferase